MKFKLMRRTGGMVVVASGFVIVVIVAMIYEAPSDPERIMMLDNSPGRSVILWDRFPDDIGSLGVRAGGSSNIHPSDYVGPESCKTCHPGNYSDWSQHSHRWMNAVATVSVVKGDFSTAGGISYLGGTARFSHEDGACTLSGKA